MSKTIKDSNYFSNLSKQRRNFSGGKIFKDKEKARLAQRKSVESRRRNNEIRKVALGAEGKTDV